jgi:hypothetical protein
VGGTGHVSRVEEEANQIGILRKSFKEGVRLEDLSVGMRIILKRSLKKQNGKICLGRI